MSDSPADLEKHYQGKKYRMTIFGLVGIMVVFFVAVLVMLENSALAGSIVSLSQVVVTALSGAVAVYSGAQAWVDSRPAK